jgi:hypothetical protein
MAEAQTPRQTAALCVARIFQGRGHELVKEAGKGFGAVDEPSITDREKTVLEDLFNFFLVLIEGEGEEDTHEAARISRPGSKITDDVVWDRRMVAGEKADEADD